MGTVIRLDMNKHIRTPRADDLHDARTWTSRPSRASHSATATDRGEHDAEGRGPLFKDPYPLLGALFLVAHKPEGPVWNDPRATACTCSTSRAERHLLYRDPEISCWLPYPLQAAPVPPVLASERRRRSWPQANQAVCVVSDVYHGLKDVPRGTIKYIRVLEQIPRPWAARRRWPGDDYDQQHACITKDTHLGLKVQHGVVPVEDDGSAHFVVPAEANVFLQVLDDQLHGRADRADVRQLHAGRGPQLRRLP